VYSAATLRGSADDEAEVLRRIHEHGSAQLVAAGLQSVAVLAMGVVLWYLYRATKYRRPETPAVALVLAVASPIVYAVLAIAIQAVRVDVASDYVHSRDQSVAHAKELLTEGTARTVGLIGLAPSLALGFAFVLIALNAMRAGLLSRFMGILGIIVGALYVIPFLGGPQIIQVFWVGAAGLVIANRWPGGRGPAWEEGEAIPWPSAAELRAAREPEPELAAADPETPGKPHPDSRKRKRKRRR
jgi:uncharacterized protein DUF4386